ncbi:syntaxin-binding protein 4 [Rhincodon typus]|uniref:syntaxin-binding protein 4 n=1 Tax=Rhincodon typus TaxID=259920 RepID=UPI002030AB05|nr:syntaxin-binding protein 4 [Rhincodon typus]
MVTIPWMLEESAPEFTSALLYKNSRRYMDKDVTVLGPYGVDRRVHCVDFTDCENGLGIKVIGGLRELTGEEYGVYVKRILPGGLASVDGQLQPGDQILEVNGESLVGVTNESAVEILRAASSSNNMRLMIARDEQGRREFLELLANYGSRDSTGSARNSPIPQGCGTITIAFLPGKGSIHSAASLHNGDHLMQKSTGNSYSSCRMKVHVRTPKPQLEDHCPVPFQSPDICPLQLTASAAKTSIQKEVPSIKRKVSLDPHVRLKVDKLELALKYLGLHVTEEQTRQLRLSLTNDSQGTVAFGDFVQAARITLPQELEDVGLSQRPLMFSPHEVANLLDTTAFQSPIFSSKTFHNPENVDYLQSEVTELRQEIKKLKAVIMEMEKNKKALEEELQQITQRATATAADNRMLQNKLHLASAVQHGAHSAEQDYEEAVCLLEAEILDLRTQLEGKAQRHSAQLNKENNQDLRERLSIANSQLQTSELSRKHLEISNRKLLSFVEKVHKVLTSATLQGTDQGVFKTKHLRRESGLALPGPEQLLAAEAKQLIEGICSPSCENNALTKTHGTLPQELLTQNRKSSREKNASSQIHRNSPLQEILFI